MVYAIIEIQYDRTYLQVCIIEIQHDRTYLQVCIIEIQYDRTYLQVCCQAAKKIHKLEFKTFPLKLSTSRDGPEKSTETRKE